MSDGTTTNYSFTLPEVGASADSWGTKNNANWTLNDTTLALMLPKAGGTMTGALIHAVGALSTPGITFAGDLNSGAYWIGADHWACVAGGVNIIDVAATGVAVTGTLSASGLVTISAGANLTLAAVPATNAVGYLGAPQNIQNASYTTVMADSGKHLYHTSGSAHTWTIDSNANVAYPIGTVVVFINESGGGVVTIAITSDTLRWSSATGSRSLAANGFATALKVTATSWRITGDGLT